MNVELIDVMGSDLSVVNAARVSYSKESEWDSITPAGPTPCLRVFHRLRHHWDVMQAGG